MLLKAANEMLLTCLISVKDKQHSLEAATKNL